jgi:hypothetical protein
MAIIPTLEIFVRVLRSDALDSMGDFIFFSFPIFPYTAGIHRFSTDAGASTPGREGAPLPEKWL